MDAPFREFFHNETIDFKKLNSNTLIVFDTNTLLNIYRYSNDTRQKLIDVMDSIQNNIWIPYQVGLEFNFQRRKVIEDLKNDKSSKLQEVTNKFKDFQKNIQSVVFDIKLKSTDAMDSKNRVLENLKDSLSVLEENLSNEINEVLSLVDLEEDLAGRLGTIFKDRIGNSYTQEELDKVLSDASERYELNIPPGYKDKEKKELFSYNGLKFQKKYGDLIVWHQILDKAREESINKVIFITDDNKEDWWYKIAGKTIGPRAELKNEMLRVSQADFFMFNSNSFLNQFELEKFDLITEDFETDWDTLNYDDVESPYQNLDYEEARSIYSSLLIRRNELERNKQAILKQIFETEDKIYSYESSINFNKNNDELLIIFEDALLKERTVLSNLHEKLSEIDHDIIYNDHEIQFYTRALGIDSDLILKNHFANNFYKKD